MKKLLLSFFALVVPFMVLAGNRITEQQAMQIAGEFLNSSKVRMASGASSSRNLKMVKKTVGEEYFICSDAMNHSFVIISGDDAVGPVLAYSTKGAFVTENMPENVKFYLKMLEGEVKYYREHPNAAPVRSNVTADDPEVVLVTAEWNQSEPYNNYVPMDGSRRSYTGCLATAMAIVMKYHNWPDCGVGTIPAYTTETKGIKVPAIELGYAYDWDNMLMQYKSGRWSDAQASAVARLMADCGASIEMDYTSGGSGAIFAKMAPALSTYFKYDKSIKFLWRSSCSKPQWVNYIHDDIDNNRPILFGGQSNEGGHCFVGDGYRGTDYVHINFGWGGSDNGFYHVTSLDGFGSYVNATLNIKPDAGGSPTVPEFKLGYMEDITCSPSPSSYKIGGDFSVSAAIANYGDGPFRGDIGAGIVGLDNKLKNIVYEPCPIEADRGYQLSFSFKGGVVKAGEKAQIVYRATGKQQEGWVLMPFYEDEFVGAVYPAGQKENFIKYVKFSYDKSTKTMSFILPYNDVIDESTGATEFSWKLKDKSGNVVTSAVTYNDLVISIATGSLSAGKYTLELSYWDVTKSITLPIDNSVE